MYVCNNNDKKTINIWWNKKGYMKDYGEMKGKLYNYIIISKNRNVLKVRILKDSAFKYSSITSLSDVPTTALQRFHDWWFPFVL